MTEKVTRWLTDGAYTTGDPGQMDDSHPGRTGEAGQCKTFHHATRNCGKFKIRIVLFLEISFNIFAVESETTDNGGLLYRH